MPTYSEACEAKTQEQADVIFKAIMEYATKKYPEADPKKLARTQRSNIGYYAGYYDHETRIRIEKFYRCKHPIFGKAEPGKPVDPEVAFRAGFELGKKTKQKKRRRVNRFGEEVEE